MILQLHVALVLCDDYNTQFNFLFATFIGIHYVCVYCYSSELLHEKFIAVVLLVVHTLATVLM